MSLKDDALVGILGIVLSGIIAWMAQLTVMVFDIDKDIAVSKVKHNREQEEKKEE